MEKTRRNFLLGIMAVGGGFMGYSVYRGIRLPTLHWDPQEPSTHFDFSDQITAHGNNFIQTKTQSNTDVRLRAYAPEPTLTIQPTVNQKISLEVNNIAFEATLNSNDPSRIASETVSKITRVLELDLIANEALTLAWKMPNIAAYRFACIGDTGGGKELAWCLERAKQLDAMFLLHLGDFNYQAGDYQSSIDQFSNSEMPIYVSIGNHDFHEDGAIYDTFTREIGPLNHAFTLGKTRFVNIDTAAKFLPYGSGARGKMFEQLKNSPAVENTIAYTHCPLYDPDPERHHDMGSEGEKQWLIEQLKGLNIDTLLSGHIHIYDQRNIDGIENIIVGQGLGHQDLITNSDYSKIAVGDVDESGRVTISIEPLSMPMEMHCHPRSNPVKQSLSDPAHQSMLQMIEQACDT